MKTLVLLLATVALAAAQDTLCATSRTAIIGALGRNACSLSCHAKFCGSGNCVEQLVDSNGNVVGQSNNANQPFYNPYGNQGGNGNQGQNQPYYNPYGSSNQMSYQQQGYNQGYGNQGYSQGYNQGYNQQYNQGYNQGYGNQGSNQQYSASSGPTTTQWVCQCEKCNSG